MLETTTLAKRLRHETAKAHQAAEAATGLPGAVTSRVDYARLLARLATFHLQVERTLAEPRWVNDWAAVSISLADHARSHLLEEDLRTLKSARLATSPEPIHQKIDSFGSLLGLLYVVEGSALGGLLLGPMIRRTLGDVSTRFYDGNDRGHPRPWQYVQTALARFDDQGGNQDHVIQGARDAFAVFSTHLASPLWSSAR